MSNSNEASEINNSEVELPLSATTINFPVWVQTQMNQAQPMRWGKGMRVMCPVCGHWIFHDWKSMKGLMRKLEKHLNSRPPWGLQFLAFKQGDRVRVGSESFVVYSGPHRPTLNTWGHEAWHVFYLKLKRVSDRKLFYTSWKQPGQIIQYSRQKRPIPISPQEWIEAFLSRTAASIEKPISD